MSTKVFVHTRTPAGGRFKCRDCSRKPSRIARYLTGILFEEERVVEGGGAELTAEHVYTLKGRCWRCAFKHFFCH